MMALTRVSPVFLLLVVVLPLSSLGQRYRTQQQQQQQQQRLQLPQQLHRGNHGSFSPTCHLGDEGELLCDRCQPGYSGPRCDSCANGYYGQPTVPGGSCQPCDCHDNLDLDTPRSCDPITGQCLRCRQGYGGVACETCSEGFYGDAINAKNCQPCHCHTNGSVSEACNKETGQCHCREHVIGNKCDECMPNCWWDAERQECLPCRCSPQGALAQRCDVQGRCICRPGFVGHRCDLRRPGYERRETRRPVERVPMETVQQRWGGSSRTGGCPRGAYRPKAGVQMARSTRMMTLCVVLFY